MLMLLCAYLCFVSLPRGAMDWPFSVVFPSRIHQLFVLI